MHCKLHRAGSRAIRREIDSQRGIGLKAALALIADDAEDLSREIALAFPQERLMANWILPWPERVREALADDNAPRLADLVVLIEGAAMEHGNAHGAEVIAADDAPTGPGESSVVAVGFFCRHNAHAGVPSHDWARIHGSDGLDARCGTDAIEKAID